MRALSIILLTVLFASAPASASEPPCVVRQATFDTTQYRFKVLPEEVVLGHAYTAEPPVEAITQHYEKQIITHTVTITVTNPPPPHTEVVTYVTRTFHYSETTAPLGYTPLIATPPDYGYFLRSQEPFRVWECAPTSHAHTFVPLIVRPAVD